MLHTRRQRFPTMWCLIFQKGQRSQIPSIPSLSRLKSCGNCARVPTGRSQFRPLGTIAAIPRIRVAALPATIRARKRSRKMKLRHAAMVALAGWFLLAPPQRSGKQGLDKDAPLNLWIQTGSFSTADACKSERARRIDSFTSSSEVVPESLATTLCIDSDDSRLAK